VKKYPYIEPTIRTIAGSLVTACGVAILIDPNLLNIALGVLFFVGLNLFQSSFTQFCLMEKILKRLGFRSQMDEIRRMALHDALTGLPNRANLEERIASALSLAKRNDYKVAMLFIDIDSFKQVNDLHGHKVGDQLLVSMANLLSANVRRHDTVARWGGDEFVIVLPYTKSLDSCLAVAEKLKATVQLSDAGESQHNHSTLSIGISVFPDDGDTTEALLVQADKALYYAKAQGRNNIQVYSRLRERGLGFVGFDLSARFAAAVSQHKIAVHYQPIVDAKSTRLVGMEALARWCDNGTWVSPGVFIPMAENLGLIHELGQHVLERALSDYRTLCGPDQPRLAVNISNRQLFSNTFVADITARVAQHGLTPQQLKLEVTESIALDTHNAQRTLKQLADAGFYLSIDDFGTGFSSLSRLHELPVNELKIDISFVRRAKTEEGKVMLRTIANMAHDMKLALVAEGVEDQETADILRAMGIEYLQGYCFGRPMPPDEFTRHRPGAAASQLPAPAAQVPLANN